MAIRNTTQEALDNPVLALLTASDPRNIENQVRHGQHELEKSQDIPTECRYTDDQLEKMGFKLQGPRPEKNDELFRSVTLPKGWSVQRTDHPMWSDLVDDKGRKRGSMFYKAAFYDREAFLGTASRYTIEQDYSTRGSRKNEGLEVYTFVVKDHGQGPEAVELFRTEASIPDFEADREGWLKQQEPCEKKLQEKCRSFLVERVGVNLDVLRNDPLAYWDLV